MYLPAVTLPPVVVSPIGVRGLFDEGNAVVAQKIEHYEIAAYGALRQFAWVLGDTAAADVLDMTIKEEGHVDHVLSQIADRINVEAKHGRDAQGMKGKSAA